MRAPCNSLHRSIGHLQNLLMQGSLRADLLQGLGKIIRTCTRSCKDLEVLGTWPGGFTRFSPEDLYKTLVNNLPENSWDLFARIFGNQPKWARYNKESRPRRTKWRKGCASDISISTAPQQDKSDPTTAKWHEGCASDVRMHAARSATRVIGRAQSDEIARTTKTESWKYCFTYGFHMVSTSFSSRSLEYSHRKLVSGIRSACHAKSSSCTKSKMTTVSQNEILEPFKTLSSSPNTAHATKHDVWNHLANVLAMCTKYRACMPRGWNGVGSLAPVTQNDARNSKTPWKSHAWREKST